MARNGSICSLLFSTLYMNKTNEIFAFHLYNDFSGSPKVLKSVLNGLTRKGYHLTLFTSKNGILDSLEENRNITIKEVPYKFQADSKIKTALKFFFANVRYLFLVLFASYKTKPIIYINTIMPWGAALGAKLRGLPIIYHYHENAYVKGKLYRGLTRLMEKIADKIICVSKTQAETLKRNENVFIVSNGLDNEIGSRVCYNPTKSFQRKNILMLSSLKGFKGVNEFCILARTMPQYKFTLVLNDSEDNCMEFRSANKCDDITNLSVYSRTSDVSRFYNDASIVVNLSDKRKFIETFGLTIIEGMAAGLPVIVPSAGGPAEIVKDGENGFIADVENLSLIKNRIDYIFSSYEIYLQMSKRAYDSAKNFTEAAMIDKISDIIDQLN